MSTVVSTLFANDRVYREVVNVCVGDDPALHDRGFSLLVVMLDKLAQLFDHWSGAQFQGAKKQIVFRLGEKLPPVARVATHWHNSLKKLSTVELEDGPRPDDLANDLCSATKAGFLDIFFCNEECESGCDDSPRLFLA